MCGGEWRKELYNTKIMKGIYSYDDAREIIRRGKYKEKNIERRRSNGEDNKEE